MEMYLPMKKRVRTKVKIGEGGIVIYQQKRCGLLFMVWRKVEATPEMSEYVTTCLNQKPSECF